jgi:hypothetical protein
MCPDFYCQTFYLGPLRYFKPESGSDTADKNGELTLGGVDSSKFSGSLTYTPKLSSGTFAPYWGISVSGISYGGTSLGSGSAIVDTGKLPPRQSHNVHTDLGE